MEIKGDTAEIKLEGSELTTVTLQTRAPIANDPSARILRGLDAIVPFATPNASHLHIIR